jgi:HD-like signal output (HDOD) protein
MDLNDSPRKRILFVDDEPNVLDGLRRMLFSARKRWDMVFVTGADEAMKALALEPFDILVTDMRMPGTDGAELLDQVVKYYPEMVRLVLSGQGDAVTAARSAKTAHQYLTKPCSADTLKTTLERIFALRHMLAGKSLKRLVSGMTTLPSLPVIYQRLLETLDSPEASTGEIGNLVVHDIAMAAKVMQLVNSAFFGIPRRITDLSDAIQYLGVETIKALALTVGVFSQFQGPQAASLSLEALQQHSLDTARVARVIAKHESLPRQAMEDAFLAGLVHDIGKLILITKDAEMYDRAMAVAQAEKLPPDPVEREVFGADHAEVGSYLLWLWALPQGVTEAVGFHHQPALCPAAGLSAVALVHIADALAHEGGPLDDSASQLDQAYLTSMGLIDRVPEWRVLAHEALSENTA